MSFTPNNEKIVIVDDQVEIVDQIDTTEYVVDFSKSTDINHHLIKLCNSLGLEYSDLFSLIAYETAGTFSAKITNPNSGARGLLQFTNSTSRKIRARDGRYLNNADELVAEYSTAIQQLEMPGLDSRYGGPVYQYFSKFGVPKNKRELYLSVFYPIAVNWPDSRILPKEVTDGNPGIVTVGDYVKMIERRIQLNNKVAYD